MRSFFALVQYTDASGVHPAGSIVNLPYDNDADIADVQSLIRYGVITEQAPAATLRPNNENPVVADVPPQSLSVVLTLNDENPQPAEEPEVTTHDHEVGEQEAAPIEEASSPEEPAGQTQEFPTPDDPETPEWDARNEDGSFASKEAVEAKEEAPAPKKRSARKR